MTRRTLSHLSDNQLLVRVQELAKKERKTTLDILVHLGEVERRRLHLTLGCSSLFDYCTRHLGYSSSAAYRRIQTARCLRTYPELHELFYNNEVNLTTVSLVASVLRSRRGLIEKIRNKTQREVEAIVAAYRPPSAFRDRVRPVRVPISEPAPRLCEKSSYCRTGTAAAAGSGLSVNAQEPKSTAGDPDGTPEPKEKMVVDGRMLEQRLLIQFLAHPGFMQKYNKARSLVSNKLTNTSFENVFEVLVDEFLERHDPERREARRERRKNRGKTTTKKARCKENAPSRHIPPAVRDQVFTRDEGGCTYAGIKGTRCGSTIGLEVDHIVPFARGGPNTAANLRLLCSQHNLMEAEREFGVHRMKQFRRRE